MSKYPFHRNRLENSDDIQKPKEKMSGWNTCIYTGTGADGNE